ncbi:helix-turn-helix transcriptional regulator [Gluconobacter sp. LMG 31484]|uniref:Helix-turn-helix transcriptional regulator n=2 Tax=Gluconobacter vitians TaxID=2728102 RepID=A0ABR9Y6S6_9PROT|nr:helix-turn-helix transcriptional regulator [Gluconobacter vitians]
MFRDSAKATRQNRGMAKQVTISASDIRSAFSARLSMLREAFGRELGRPSLTRKEFAELLGLEAERYSTYERGTREPPLSVLAKIHVVTGVNLNGLIAGDIDKAA